MNELKKKLQVGDRSYTYYSLNEAKSQGLARIERLPKCLKILLENLLRKEDGQTITWKDAQAIDNWSVTKTSNHEIAYNPTRIILQDFTGVPAVVDLAAMRDAMSVLGKNPQQINPQIPVDLVIDHSVNVEYFGSKEALEKNVDIEYQKNDERYRFLKWGQKAFGNFRVVPPGTGIVHQINLEYLAKVVWTHQDPDGQLLAYPDSCVGTDSHTTMINGLSVLGWGVGGIEAEATMLGCPISMLIPEVIGLKLEGELKEGVTATDLVLNVVEILRKHGVVGKFVEFFGSGLSSLSLADRATLANMAPEYGATCGFFPIDQKTIDYLKFSGRPESQVQLVEAYAKEQGLWFDEQGEQPVFSDTLQLDMHQIEPCISGPKRPQDKIVLSQAKKAFKDTSTQSLEKSYPVEEENFSLKNGHVVIAAITSCTNTSNPSVLVAAGLVARKAQARGLNVPPWVKTSLAPGSKVVTDYLLASGLQDDLDALGFHVVGHGCTTCIGNSGPLSKSITEAIHQHDLCVSSVLSGNRNFEGRISPAVKANYLASPPLVVCYALAGTMNIDLTKEPLGTDSQGHAVFMKDLWPLDKEIEAVILEHIDQDMYNKNYTNVFDGDNRWKAIPILESDNYQWDQGSTYIAHPNFFDKIEEGVQEDFHIKGAHILALLGDSITTDHISPAGSIRKDSPAGQFLLTQKVNAQDFNSYGARRGNHHVMARGTFANIRIKNEMLPGIEGGFTLHIPTGKQMSIYDAAEKYREEGRNLVIIAGKEYGTGSSRDWAAKGTRLQGVKAVIAESFERIHRSNLIGMGVMPLQFDKGEGRKSLNLQGDEIISCHPIGPLAPKVEFELNVQRRDQSSVTTKVFCRCDTGEEIEYFKNGGILQYVLRKMSSEKFEHPPH